MGGTKCRTKPPPPLFLRFAAVAGQPTGLPPPAMSGYGLDPAAYGLAPGALRPTSQAQSHASWADDYQDAYDEVKVSLCSPAVLWSCTL